MIVDLFGSQIQGDVHNRSGSVADLSATRRVWEGAYHGGPEAGTETDCQETCCKPNRDRAGQEENPAAEAAAAKMKKDKEILDKKKSPLSNNEQWPSRSRKSVPYN